MMGVHTSYDEMRDRLKEQLDESLKLAKEMVVTEDWGAEQFNDDYKMEVYQAVKKARDTV